MYKIVTKQELTPNVKMFNVHAPAVAHKAVPGQFVIVRAKETGERLPITVAGTDPEEGTVLIYFAEVGKSSTELGALGVGDEILNFAGPLGNATEIKDYGNILCVGGGVFVGAMLYQIRAFKEAGNHVTAVFGFRNKDHVMLEEELKEAADEAYICTDDGSYGLNGMEIVDELLGKQAFDHVFTIGPTSLQKNLCDRTLPYGIPTNVNLFPIMVDGMGMCGACRVTVAGDTRFSCVDGPEFDGHQVDFDELIMRMRLYNPQEKIAMVVYNREAED
ncbi:sulfide/dihydroorotate dehydrogenase-like FAD/NAD-binding protein [Candidatus Bathyarchaeota archaeon]|nr:sulfide/dihydroorotate dehydrogenase-like FAD/NAD-binding protein [Candidatus Bathyarchaeota archaeon]